MKRSIVFFFLLVLPFISNGQGTQYTGAPTQVNAIRGGAKADSAQWLPIGFAIYPWFDSTGRIWYSSIDSSLYYHTGHKRVKLGSGGGGGSTDTTSLSHRIDLKVNKSDSNLLSGYFSYFAWLRDSSLIMNNFTNYATLTQLTNALAPYATIASTWSRTQIDSILTAKAYETISHAAATYYPLTNPTGYITNIPLADTADSVRVWANGKFYPLSNPNNYVDNTPNIDSSNALRALANTKVSLAKHTADSIQYYLTIGDTAAAIRAYIAGLPNYGISTTDIGHWNTAYNKYITTIAFNKTTGALTVTLNDATTVTANLDGRYTLKTDLTNDSVAFYTALNDTALAHMLLINSKVSKAQADTTYLNRSDSTKYYTSLNKFNQRPDLFRFNYIGGAETDTPIIKASTSGGDQRIRELGNMQYDSAHRRWLFCYTGYIPPYAGNISHAFIVESRDNRKTWTLLAELDSLTEDPYLIIYHNSYLIYAENKRNGINITEFQATDTTLSAWTYLGVALDTNSIYSSGLESSSVSSPLAQIVNDSVYLYYEGSPFDETYASIFLAKSPNGLAPFTRYSPSPVAGGTKTISTFQWATTTVPDDIVSNNGRYFMTTETSSPNGWVTGLLMSTDHIHWKDYLNTWLLNQNPQADDGEAVMPYLADNDLSAVYVDTAAKNIRTTHFIVKTTTQDDIANIKQNGNAYGTSVNIGSNDNQTLSLKTNALKRMFIFPDGHIGIGDSVEGIGTVHTNGAITTLVNSAGSYAYQWGYNNFYYSLMTGNGRLMLGGAANNTYNPTNMLDVSGGASIGADYTGANGAVVPTNGMNIEGRICINTRADDGINYIQTKSRVRTGTLTIDSIGAANTDAIDWGFNGAIYGSLVGQGYATFGKGSVVQNGQVDIYPVLTSRRGLTITQKDSTTSNQPDLFECLSPSGTQRLAAFTHYGGLYAIDTAILAGYTYLKSTPAYTAGGDSMLVKNATTQRIETIPVIAYVDSVKRIGDTVWYYKAGVKTFAFTDSLGSGGGGGTVTSIATTKGILGGTITTTGTLYVDTTGTSGTAVASQAWVNNKSYLTGNQTVTLSGDITGSGTTAITTAIGASKVTNAMLAGSIDLTSKVTNVLPIANGGTNSTATPTAGGIAYGTGTSNAYTAASTAGNPIVSGGASAPTFEVIAEQTITDGATITFNASNGINQKVTLGGNRTLAISNAIAGKVYLLRIIQDATGTRTVTWPATFKWAGGTAPTLTTTAAHYDIITFYYDGTNYNANYGLDYK